MYWFSVQTRLTKIQNYKFGRLLHSIITPFKKYLIKLCFKCQRAKSELKKVQAVYKSYLYLKNFFYLIGLVITQTYNLLSSVFWKLNNNE